MANSQAVYKLYKSVMDDVITNVREAFLDEGVDEQVLQELKQIWESKLMMTKAVDLTPQPLPQTEDSSRQREKARGGASSSGSGHLPAQLQLQAQQRTAAVGSSVPQQQGSQAFQISGATTQLSSSAAAATLAFQQGVLQLPHQLTTLPAGLTLAQPQAGGTQTFPAYTLSQPHGALQAGAYQAVLPNGQTVMIHPSPQTTQTQPPPPQQQQQQQQSQQAPGTINLTTVQARVLQVDGANDTSDEEEDEEEEEDNENEDEENEDNEYANDVEEESLNSDDDVSDEDPEELFETENVVVCQYDKINRSRNRWKFHLKNGIMNLKGRDYVFFKASGDANW
ncbi:transcription initiation factor IIA subunit 1-like isoform X2 [Acanthaster planci]|uniref:Transcription initiation factor IIA subunit 1-like isoform X2 n=1 Tax=Acanthaster planci TaxID=133434 RepID=A0A8B7Z996_ACAPL|nr:transcription initiation factor IIA subunit 1-like isoform X2 [Acanthaster planci]